MQNKIIEVALTQLDAKEDPIGSNWGEPVQSYLKSVAINFPAAWCMAFVYWCVEQAKIKIPDGTGGLRNPLVKTASVMEQWREIETQAFQPKSKFETPQPGDIFIMDFGKGLGHTGFVERIEGDVLHTIEGNTNDSGGREGYEVCRRVRHASKCVGFIRV